MSSGLPDLYRVWDADNRVYGPVSLTTLVQWVEEERVLPETFIHAESGNLWHRAGNFGPLQPHLADKETAAPNATRLDRSVDLNPAELRQFPVFADLTDIQLKQFASLGDFFGVLPDKLILKQGDPCDAIYFVLSGTLRVRLLIGVEPMDTTLCRISGGEFFGEVGMFLQSTRTADVLAETPARVLRMSSNAFHLLVRQTPELAAPVLFTLAATMAKRMAEDNQRFAKEVTSEFLWR